MIVEARNLKKIYKNNRGLHEADFAIRRGRIVALAGGNGAGKSTLIRLLTNQEKPTGGELIWHNRGIVRYMPDDVDFPGMLTAEEVLGLLASLKKVGKAEQDEILKRVGLYEVKKQKVSSFSKGMRQRLNLAQSLIGGDGLIIMDEPTNGLDPYWIARLKEMMAEERSRGATVLFSTHMLAFAEQLADDVIILHEGRILAAGEVERLLQDHQCRHLEDLWLQKIGL
ncbi:ABC transporter ATP-binding protein [Ureibacillus sp. FSL K6-8385]|uniref:ABC transporter ATP-binding protein n=1 Tax=Ureibacillus terrenus TaxID=118246 RepID=A0A540V3N9_9BACL|nr:ABC transporter ATP-binding protein [Ureibacillus terrenus]MED3661818.1 ABC transporter ATP-binding protein [Ureibacillus terrenus]MED3763121.1 ABC transporter ATP-binding protein [Ureibacillus terrenus]TQE91370.1 ABC transporter ATP-binding protein [Ureibacillus terrenus]